VIERMVRELDVVRKIVNSLLIFLKAEVDKPPTVCKYCGHVSKRIETQVYVCYRCRRKKPKIGRKAISKKWIEQRIKRHLKKNPNFNPLQYCIECGRPLGNYTKYSLERYCYNCGARLS